MQAVNASGAASLYELFGAPDDQKFRSSMTLFSVAVPNGPYWRALQRWCDGRADERTLELLRGCVGAANETRQR